MEIPEKLKNKWLALRSPGDAEKLADKLPGSAAETFNRAFRTGKCRDEVFQIMATYYNEKAELVKQYL